MNLVNNKLNYKIRLEKNKDSKIIENLLDDTFGEDRASRSVYKFRNGQKVKSLCYVIEKKFEIITPFEIYASIRFWPIKIGLLTGLLLGPLAVRKDFQGFGFGSVLIKKALLKAYKEGWCFCFVSGEADYYPKFGFKKINKKNINFPGSIDPNRLHIKYFNDESQKKMGKVPWIISTF